MNRSDSHNRGSLRVSTERLLDSNVYAATENGTEVVFDELDSSYIPSEGEIDNMAINLGMDLDENPEYRSIVVRAIREPLPPNYCYLRTKDGEIYVVDMVTQEILTENPNLAKFRERVRSRVSNTKSQVDEIDLDSETQKPAKRLVWSFKKKKSEVIFREDDELPRRLSKNVGFNVRAKLKEAAETKAEGFEDGPRISETDRNGMNQNQVFKSFKDVNFKARDLEPVSITSLKMGETTNLFCNSARGENKTRANQTEALKSTSPIHPFNPNLDKQQKKVPQEEEECVINADFNVITHLFQRVEMLVHRINEIETLMNDQDSPDDDDQQNNVTRLVNKKRYSNITIDDDLLSEASSRRNGSLMHNRLVEKRNTSHYAESEFIKHLNDPADYRKLGRMVVNKKSTLSNRILRNDLSGDQLIEDINNENGGLESRFFADVVQPKRVVSPDNNARDNVELFHPQRHDSKRGAFETTTLYQSKKTDVIVPNALQQINPKRNSLESSALVGLKNDVREIKETLHNLFFNPQNASILQTALNKTGGRRSQAKNNDTGMELRGKDGQASAINNINKIRNSLKTSHMKIKIENFNANTKDYQYFNESAELALRHPGLKDFFINNRQVEAIPAPKFTTETSHHFRIQGFNKWVKRAYEEREVMAQERNGIQNDKVGLKLLISAHHKLAMNFQELDKALRSDDPKLMRTAEVYRSQQAEIEDARARLRQRRQRYIVRRLLLKRLNKLIMDNSTICRFSADLEQEFERLYKEYKDAEYLSVDDSCSFEDSELSQNDDIKNELTNRGDLERLVESLKKNDEAISIARMDKDFGNLTTNNKGFREKNVPESANKYSRPTSSRYQTKLNLVGGNQLRVRNIKYGDEYEMGDSIEEASFSRREETSKRYRIDNKSDTYNLYQARPKDQKAEEPKTVESMVEEMQKKYNLRKGENHHLLYSERRNLNLRPMSTNDFNSKTHKILPPALDFQLKRPSSQETLKIQSRDFAVKKNFETPTPYFSEMKFELNDIAKKVVLKTCK